MKKYVCLIFAKHEESDKTYLFCVEPMADIEDEQKIMVDTCRGDQIAYAVGNSFVVDERGAESIIKAVGAYWPLKNVIGLIKPEVIRKEKFESLDPGLPF